jgi:hypothetical protein
MNPPLGGMVLVRYAFRREVAFAIMSFLHTDDMWTAVKSVKKCIRAPG